MTAKTVLITGANKGIGFESAKQLAQLGYKVYIGSRDKSNGQRAVNQLGEIGLTNVDFIEIDVTNMDSIKSARQELGRKVQHLDVLINNAGIYGDSEQTATIISMETLRTVFEINFFGAVQTTQAFIDLMKKSDQPRIVNLSSGLGSLTLQSDPLWEYYRFKSTAYTASKASLNAFTIMLADELMDANFKVNSVNPGYTKTDFNNNTGEQPVEQAAKIVVKYATLDKNGVTGKFISQEGQLAW